VRPGRGRLGGEAERSQREAIAEAVEREGNAQAAAILARGRAEAETMEKRAEAFARYGDAACSRCSPRSYGPDSTIVAKDRNALFNALKRVEPHMA
jgi:uncharacterized membrane protein YqiK